MRLSKLGSTGDLQKNNKSSSKLICAYHGSFAAFLVITGWKTKIYPSLKRVNILKDTIKWFLRGKAIHIKFWGIFGLYCVQTSEFSVAFFFSFFNFSPFSMLNILSCIWQKLKSVYSQSSFKRKWRVCFHFHWFLKHFYRWSTHSTHSLLSKVAACNAFFLFWCKWMLFL